MSLAARRIWPDPWLEPADPEPEFLAEVIQLRPYVSGPQRQSINGHHPDCPYPTQRHVDYCPVCQGIRKGCP